MKIAILALTCLAGGLISAPAQEEQTPAMKLLEMMNFRKNAQQASAAMFGPALQNMEAQGLPKEAIQEIAQAAKDFFHKVYDNPEITKEIAQVYSDNFSDEEINELILFYETPLGQKTLATMPQVMQSSAQIGQKYAMKNQKELQQQIQDIVLKHTQKAAEKQNQGEEAPVEGPAAIEEEEPAAAE